MVSLEMLSEVLGRVAVLTLQVCGLGSGFGVPRSKLINVRDKRLLLLGRVIPSVCMAMYIRDRDSGMLWMSGL